MKRFDQNDVIGWLIMVPLIVLIWAVSGYLVYEIINAVFWGN
jgi:hypothetical protein